jgi:hypothetical protein
VNFSVYSSYDECHAGTNESLWDASVNGDDCVPMPLSNGRFVQRLPIPSFSTQPTPGFQPSGGGGGALHPAHAGLIAFFVLLTLAVGGVALYRYVPAVQSRVDDGVAWARQAIDRRRHPAVLGATSASAVESPDRVVYYFTSPRTEMARGLINSGGAAPPRGAPTGGSYMA